MTKRYLFYVRYKNGGDLEAYSDDLQKLKNYYAYSITKRNVRECYIWDQLDKGYIDCHMCP